MERLQKVLAQAGFGSRRACEQLILDGVVTVNEEVVKELGTKVDLAVDEIHVKGKRVRLEKPVYYVLNKPKGVITSATDPAGRKVVTDYMPGVKARVFPVGRLDYDTEGLLLLTNDGEFAHAMTHPSHEVPKTYHVTVEGIVHNDTLDKLSKGIRLEDGMTLPAEVEYVDVDPERKRTIFSITIREGRNRQIRRMCESLHLNIILLKRVKYGDLLLGHLPRGKYRELLPKEIEELRKLAGLSPIRHIEKQKPEIAKDKILSKGPNAKGAKPNRNVNGPSRSEKVSNVRSEKEAPVRSEKQTSIRDGNRTISQKRSDSRRNDSRRGEWSNSGNSGKSSNNQRSNRNSRAKQPRRTK